MSTPPRPGTRLSGATEMLTASVDATCRATLTQFTKDGSRCRPVSPRSGTDPLFTLPYHSLTIMAWLWRQRRHKPQHPRRSALN